jgi:glyoxylase-like metal-dependent hydrolase (beta-lactamase superfamily II)
MGHSVHQVNESTWIIENGGVRLFLLAGTEKALLIDSGMELRTARDIAEELTDKPVELLNTHADRDHIGSNGQFDTFYMHPREEPLYHRDGRTGTVLPVQEGDRIDLGQRVLEIIDLPGHTPGSIAVLDVKNRVLISGDPVQAHGRIFMFGSHRNMDDYVRSLTRLESFTDRFDEIWPSHGDIPAEKELIPKLRRAAESILKGEAKGHTADLFGSPIMVYDFGFASFLCDP